jgi:membrane protein DedA with SNARE-associated domain/rhodanese-related sulfurtransferase
MDFLRGLFAEWGALIVLVNTLLHEAGVPVPLTPTVIVAGAMDSTALGITSTVLAVVLGSVVGNSIWFYLGRRSGSSVLRTLCRLSLSPDTCVAKTSNAFDRWGPALLAVGRFIPGVSLVAPPMAGMSGMSWPRFLWLTAAGAALWGAVMVLAGSAFEAAIAVSLRWIAGVRVGPWEVVLLVVGGYIAWRLVRRRAQRQLKGVPRLDIDALRAALQRDPPAIVIDVRGTVMRASDDGGGIEAIAVDLQDIDGFDIARLSGRQVVIFCGCPNEASAATAALKLQSRGVRDVHVLRGGVDALSSL